MGLLATIPTGSAGAAPARGAIPLLAPVHDVDPLQGSYGLRKDRLLKSVVPGPVETTEQITVEVGPTGAPTEVVDLQQLVITKPGSYIVRELGPAREAEGLGDTVPPVLELGQVVWQGFSPGTRTLRALLTLDPSLEVHRLPMTVSLEFRARTGRTMALRAGEAAPADGVVRVTLHNATAIPRVIATGRGDTRAVAAALDTLYRAATAPRAAVPPYAGSGLPLQVAGRRGADQSVNVTAPLRVTGTLGVREAAVDPVRGSGATPAGSAARIAGTLDGDASFDVDVRAGQHLVADLDVRPWLDPRLLAPPAASWRAWAAAKPSPADVTSATSTLVAAAAAAARAAEYSPYLQADTPGPDLSAFRYVMAAPTAAPRAARALRARPDGIAAAVLAVVAIAGNAALLRRQL
jgi:hypothetical protein